MTASLNRNLAPERQEKLRDIIRKNGAVRVSQLIHWMKVSPATVRRDLEILESRGKIRRVHGGAVSVESKLDEPLFDDKTSVAAREKQHIAREAAKLIVPGDTIYLDGGSTVLEFARVIADRTDITVVTNSLRAAIELSGRGPRLIIVGGSLRRLSQTMVGSMTSHVLNELRVDRAFMGTIGVSAENGLTTTDPDEAFTKRLAMSRSSQVVLLLASNKIGTSSFAHAGDLDDINVIITDKAADKAFVREARKRSINMILA